MPAYQYCIVVNAVSNKSAFMVAKESDKKKNAHSITLTLDLN